MSTLLEKVKETAQKRGYLAFGITGVEKWNQPSEHNDWGRTEGVKSDGTCDGSFDVEGHTWTDILVQYDISLKSLEDIIAWALEALDWLKLTFEAFKGCLDIKKGIFRPGLVLNYIKITYKTLGLSKSRWGITVQSFDVAIYDLAQDKASILLAAERPEMPDFDDLFSNSSSGKSDIYKKFLLKLAEAEKQLAEEISYKEVFEYVRSICRYIGRGLYVSLEDPGIIYVDNTLRPYDLKDGYSDKEVSAILADWADLCLELNVPLVDKGPLVTNKDAEIKSSLCRTLAALGKGK